MRSHNNERSRKKDTSQEPRRIKPRMTPYTRPYNRTDTQHFSEEERGLVATEYNGEYNNDGN